MWSLAERNVKLRWGFGRKLRSHIEGSKCRLTYSFQKATHLVMISLWKKWRHLVLMQRNALIILEYVAFFSISQLLVRFSIRVIIHQKWNIDTWSDSEGKNLQLRNGRLRLFCLFSQCMVYSSIQFMQKSFISLNSTFLLTCYFLVVHILWISALKKAKINVFLIIAVIIQHCNYI